ncbi:uncharacterized protein LOC103702118 isoform X1 [Phoenix dactylifera]|uniref:Uncharacterized protein LOC103702118 isoform X1 n=1 Tax=Phoenix dactylifera TaxID=42345 RepID=A0A8B7BP97_PHODC|nr:uncharacterized protein LOC103702118 isoform X1 [Phoenix dactylifera]
MDLRSGRASGGLVCKVALLFCACLCFFSVCALVSGTGSGRASVEIRNRGMDSCKQCEEALLQCDAGVLRVPRPAAQCRNMHASLLTCSSGRPGPVHGYWSMLRCAFTVTGRITKFPWDPPESMLDPFQGSPY